MDSGDVYVDNFLKFLNNFVSNIRSDDPLPVRAPSYKVSENEIDGQIIDIVYRYLNNRECPPYVRSLVANRVWAKIRHHESCEDGDDGCDMIDHSNQTFDPMHLIMDVVSKANEVMKDLISSISPEKIRKLPRYFRVSQYAIKNTRRKMEDRHIVIHDLNTLYNLDFGEPHAFFGVYDGHAGSDAVVYTSAHLHQYMIQNPLYEHDPLSALKHAFYITDTNFSKKCIKERLKGGTTAVVALVREKRLVVAWLGDSQALLVRKREPVHVVTAHKPDDPGEQERIESLGGCVINFQGTWRVLGQLAVSRAIGDVDYKPFVSSECDIKSLEIVGDEDFLILACDGLWDTLTPEHAVDIVYAYLQLKEGDTDGVGRCLVEAARSRGSEDNITAVVVFLREVTQLMEEEQIRVENGQAPKAVPFVEIETDMVPPSMNSIFVPPPELKARLETNGIADNHEQPEEMVEMRNHSPEMMMRGDYDSDEGVGIEGEVGLDAPSVDSSQLVAHVDVNPTQEEVDAALAELDSLPDGTCEAGDVDDDDEDDDDEEWNYYKGTNKVEDVPDAYQNVDPPPAFSPSADYKNLDEHDGQETLDLVTRVDTELVKSAVSENPPSPLAPSSPRSVEGFVTSVDLNTPEETFCTSFPVNPGLEGTPNGMPVLDNPSGPFSVYVSSSPEPQSIEVAPTFTESSIVNAEDDFAMNAQSDLKSTEETFEEDLEQSDLVSSVEIVHAQSTVEVITPTSSSAPSEGRPDTPPQSEDFPLIMTQSVTGELPDVPYDVDSIDVLAHAQQMDLTSDILQTEITTPDVVSPQVSVNSPTLDSLIEPIENPMSLQEISSLNVVPEQPEIIQDLPKDTQELVQIQEEQDLFVVPEIPLDIIPQFETVSAPLSETHHEPLEVPMDEFNILDVPAETQSLNQPLMEIERTEQISPLRLESDVEIDYPQNVGTEYRSSETIPEPTTPRIDDVKELIVMDTENIQQESLLTEMIPLTPESSQGLEEIQGSATIEEEFNSNNFDTNFKTETINEIVDVQSAEMQNYISKETSHEVPEQLIEEEVVSAQLDVVAPVPVENLIDDLASLTLNEISSNELIPEVPELPQQSFSTEFIQPEPSTELPLQEPSTALLQQEPTIELQNEESNMQLQQQELAAELICQELSTELSQKETPKEMPQQEIPIELSPVTVPEKEVAALVEVEDVPKVETKATPALRTSIGASKSAPKPSPRTMTTAKTPISKSSPSATADPKAKKAPSATKTPRVSSAPPTKSRPTATSSRPTSTTTKTTAATKSALNTKPSVSAPSKPKSTSTSLRPAPKPSSVSTASRLTAAKSATTTTRARPTSTTTTTSSITKSRLSTSTSSTLTSRTSATASRTSTSAKSSPTTTRTTRPAPATKSAMGPTSASTRATSTTKTTERVPLSSRTTTATKRPTSSVAGVHKSSSTTTAPRTSLATKSAAAKDPKNVSNRVPLTKPAVKSATTNKTSATTRPRSSPGGPVRMAPKSAGAKAGAKAAPKEVSPTKDAPTLHLSNGVNESSSSPDENVLINNEINEHLSSSEPQQIVETSPNEILVNGDH